jgi:hypothetical protein
VVHTRLDLKIRHRQGKPTPVFSAAMAVFQLTSLPNTLDEPLMRVGFHALAVYALSTLTH